MSHIAYVSFGANLGDRRQAIEQAAERLRGDAGVRSVRLSSLHETEPVGGPPGQEPFLNAAAEIVTDLEPDELLSLMQFIEQELGRVRTDRWGPRTIDMDLLLFDDRVIDTPELTLPHPLMHRRVFVLAPLVEVAPEAKHPLLERTVRELLDSLTRQA
jgi:2-amino-4-hydroxy-6-hydroxymethyldihydropteridine diphosphokinase